MPDQVSCVQLHNSRSLVNISLILTTSSLLISPMSKTNHLNVNIESRGIRDVPLSSLTSSDLRALRICRSVDGNPALIGEK